MPSLSHWKPLLSKEAYEQLERKYREKTCNSNTGTLTINEPYFSNEPLAEKKTPGFNSKVVIKVHSIRNRLIDCDNLFAKYVIDGLRYSGILKDDTPEIVEKVECTQEKGKVEKTIITIESVEVSNAR